MTLPFEPTPATGTEREILRAILDRNRYVMLWKLDGLTLEQATKPMTDSTTNLFGLVKHLAWVERWWFCDFIGKQEFDYPWSDDDPDADFRAAEGETVEDVRNLYVEAVGQANAVVDAAESLDVTGASGGQKRSLRWVLVHMIEETARHAGHADILREQLDGTTGYYPRN